MDKGLTKYELAELKLVLELLARRYRDGEGWILLSGGYAEAEWWDYDDVWVDIEIKHGVRNASGSVEYRENLRIARGVLQGKNLTPLEKVRSITKEV